MRWNQTAIETCIYIDLELHRKILQYIIPKARNGVAYREQTKVALLSNDCLFPFDNSQRFTLVNGSESGNGIQERIPKTFKTIG